MTSLSLQGRHVVLECDWEKVRAHAKPVVKKSLTPPLSRRYADDQHTDAMLEEVCEATLSLVKIFQQASYDERIKAEGLDKDAVFTTVQAWDGASQLGGTPPPPTQQVPPPIRIVPE